MFAVDVIVTSWSRKHCEHGPRGTLPGGESTSISTDFLWLTRLLGVMSTRQKTFPWWTTSAALVAISGNLLAAAILAYPLFQLPAGSAVRLLGESLHSAVVSLATLILGTILGIAALRKEHHRALAVIALILSLTSFFFSGWTMRYVANIRHIFLKS